MLEQRYKKTEIGDIPEGWEVVKLKNICENEHDIVAGPFGSNLKMSDYKDEGVPIIRLQNINRTEFINKDIKYVSKEKAEELKYHSYLPGDLLLAKLGDPIGKTCLVPNHIQAGIIVADVVRIRISQKKAIPKFIEFILNSHSCFTQLKRQTIGSTRPRVNLSEVRDLAIPLPPLEEQKKIAEILNIHENVIQTTKKIALRTEQLKMALTQKLLTKGIGQSKFKRTEIGEIPEGWQVKSIEEVCQLVVDCPHSTPEFVDRGILIVRNFNIIEGDLDLSEVHYTSEDEWSKRTMRCIPQKDDILFSREAPVGEACLAPDRRFSLGQRLMLMRPNRDIINPLFLIYFIYSPLFRKQLRNMTAGMTAPHVNVKDVVKAGVALPSLSEQQSIVSIISSASEKIRMEKRREEYLEQMKKGLMEDLLIGKKRVIHNGASEK